MSLASNLGFFRTFGEKRQETTKNAHTPASARSGRRTSSRNFCQISVSLPEFIGNGEYHQM
jgi:hypothetical protein